MKVYFNSIGQFIKQDTSMDLFVKGNNGNVVECYFNGLDISNPNLIFRLIIQWSDGTTTNELLMNKSLKNEYVYLTLPILKIDGMTQFIVRIYDYNIIKYTAIFERKIFENIEASDETNISSEEYQALQNSIADINKDIADLGLEIDKNIADINSNNDKIEALQNKDLVHSGDIEDLQLNKQEKLVNQENIKSIDNETLLGAGNIDLEKKYRKISDSYNKTDVDSIKNQLLALINTAQETADNKVNSSYVASEINKAVANLINNSPSALDTLQELAKALNNDPNFATTIANQIGLKANTTYVDGIKLALQNAINTEQSRITNLTSKVNENYNTLDKKIDNNYDALNSKINTEITNIDKRVSANESNISKNASDINTLNSGLSSANNNINKKLDKAQGTTLANKVAITNSNGDVTFIEKIPSANLPDTGVSVETAKNIESSSGRIITGAEIEAVIDDTTKDINAKVDCDHRYEITGATNDEHNLAIEDQQMLINKISGRTLVRNQLIKPSEIYLNNINDPINWSVDEDGTLTLNSTGTKEESDILFYIHDKRNYQKYSQIFAKVEINQTLDSSIINIFDAYNGVYLNNGGSTIYSISNDSNKISWRLTIKPNKTVSNLQVKFSLMNLSLAYGVGNEPTTVEEVLNDFPEYIPYDEGTFVHSNNKLISTGKNLWKYGDVIDISSKAVQLTNPLKAGTYTISALVTSSDTDASSCLVYFYNKEGKGFLDIYLNKNIRTSKTFTLTKDVYSIRFYASQTSVLSGGDTFTFKDIQIEYGNTATEYEPYKEEVVEGIGELKQYDYKDNQSGNDVFSSGEVDMGTLTFAHVNIDYNIFYAAVPNMMMPSNYDERLKGIKSIKYLPSTFTGIGANMDDKSILRYNGAIYIRDSSYANASSLKQSLQGVKLLYELATPTIVKNDNLPAGMSVYKGGLQEQQGTIPYVIEKQYALSIASQVKQNIEIDREQQKQINELKNDIENITFDGYSKEESDNKYAFKTTVSDINSQLSSLNVNKLNADQVQEKINQSISNLINSAPENLDTLGEIAQALKENDDVANALAMSIGQKIDKPLNGKNIFQIGASNLLFEGKLEKGLYRIEFSGSKSVQNVVYVDFTYNDTVVCPINYLDWDDLVQIGYLSFNLVQEGSLQTLFNVYGDDALRVIVDLPHITLIIEKII